MATAQAFRATLLLTVLVAIGSCDSAAPGDADNAANARPDVLHRLGPPPDSLNDWVRSTTPSAVDAANELAANSEAEGDESRGAFYLQRGRPAGIPYLIYVGTQLGHDDYSIVGARDFLDISFESIGLGNSDYTVFPTRSRLGGTLACAATSHENVPQVVCIWGAPEVMGTALFNLDRQRPKAWAAAQTRELRELVEVADS
jgi:hypothetical protein